jgi:hypothetical protein
VLRSDIGLVRFLGDSIFPRSSVPTPSSAKIVAGEKGHFLPIPYTNGEANIDTSSVHKIQEVIEGKLRSVPKDLD